MDQQTSQSIDVVSSDDNKWPTAFFTLKCSKKVSSATRLGEQLAALLHDFPQVCKEKDVIRIYYIIC